MIINKTRRSLGLKPGLVLLALLALGIVVTLGAINSKTPPAPAAAIGDATSVRDANRSQNDSPYSGGRYLMTIALLAIGGGLALYLRGRTGKATPGGEITLIERHPIRQGHELRLVEVGGDRILIGVSPNQLCVLHTAKAVVAGADDKDSRSAVERDGTDVAITQMARRSRPTGRDKQSTTAVIRSTVRRPNSATGFAAAIAAARELTTPEKTTSTSTSTSTSTQTQPKTSNSSRSPSSQRRHGTVTPIPGVYAGSGTTPFGSLTPFSGPSHGASNGRQHV